MQAVFFGFVVSVLCFIANAQAQGLIEGSRHVPISLSGAVAAVQPGDCIIIGENHGLLTHQSQQLEILKALRQQGLAVSVGLEFFTYTDQSLVDSYVGGQIAEGEFLKQIGWGSPDFSYYREQALFPDRSQGGKTWALNAPRSLTSQVAKKGLNSLTPEMVALLPPQFSLGRDSYKNRFLRLMPHLPSPEAGDRYFAAQSIWDDTMAWRAANFLDQNPQQVLVIVVGEFHVQFGGGLPDRLLARRPETKVWTFSQINTEGLTADEIQAEIQVSPEEGPRANYLWLEPAQ